MRDVIAGLVGDIRWDALVNDLSGGQRRRVALAALLTPPDAVSQSIMALPMYLLFEGGLLMARILLRMKQSESEHKELQT